MTLRGYTCPPGGEEPGRRNDVGYCLRGCAAPCVVPPLLGAMYKADVGNFHQLDYISASMLTGSGCERQVFFERFEDFYEIPKRRYWAFRGTHAHSIIEGAQDMIADAGWVQEITMSTPLVYPMAQPVFADQVTERTDAEVEALEQAERVRARVAAEEFFRAYLPKGMDAPLALVEQLAASIHLPTERFVTSRAFTGDFDSTKDLVVTVRGTTDAYNPYTRTLCDMKTASDFKVGGVIKGKKDDDGVVRQVARSWEIQLNIYRWLLARTPIPASMKARWKAFGLPEVKNKTFPAPTKLIIQAISPMEIPHTGMTYPYKSGYTTTLYDIDHVPVWNLQQTEEFVRPEALRWYKYLVLKQKPPLVHPNKSWICKSCTFNADLYEGERCSPTTEKATLALAKESPV